MSAQDYISMFDVDSSDEAVAYVNAMISDRVVYTPDGSGNGVGAGVYKTPSGGYYFYYGGYAGGGRTGDGIIFMKESDNKYYLFTGTWSNDAPNGNGTVERVYLDGSWNETESGNFVNGLWNGRVSYIAYSSADDYNFDMPFTANNGLPVEDLTAEYVNFCYENGIDDPSSLSKYENGEKKICAYDILWYDGGGWRSYALHYTSGGTVGVIGFATN